MQLRTAGAPCHDGQEEVTAEDRAKTEEEATGEDRRHGCYTQPAPSSS